jgi:hypothetical protein
MTQRPLPFPRRRPTRGERLAEDNTCTARVILHAGERVYGSGLVEWARRIVSAADGRDARVDENSSEPQPEADEATQKQPPQRARCCLCRRLAFSPEAVLCRQCHRKPSFTATERETIVAARAMRDLAAYPGRAGSNSTT